MALTVLHTSCSISFDIFKNCMRLRASLSGVWIHPAAQCKAPLPAPMPCPETLPLVPTPRATEAKPGFVTHGQHPS